MAKNPFSPDAFEPQKLRRTPRDLSHRKIFTTEFGKGMPVLAQEVFPGDTIKIESVDLAIQGMPTYFPLTSRLKVSVSYFLCRNRCVDESWEDYIFNTKTVDKAWLRMDNTRAKKMISTGSLGDMFGLPTTIAADRSYTYTSYLSEFFYVGVKDSDTLFSSFSESSYNSLLLSYISVLPPQVMLSRSPSLSDTTALAYGSYVDCSNWPSFPSKIYSSATFSSSLTNCVFYALYVDDKLINTYNSSGTLPVDSSGHYYFELSSIRSYCQAILNEGRNLKILFLSIVSLSSTASLASASTSNSKLFFTFDFQTRPVFSPFLFDYSLGTVLDATNDLVISENPFVGNNPTIPVEAHIFRHYTMVGNYYYRNDRNNPYILNGVPEYNKFIPSKASGPDDNEYDYFYRNWELDRFTGMTQTPQVGDAPLVGLTFNPRLSSSVLTFQATDAEGVSHEYKVTVGVDREYNLESIANFDKDIPSSVLRHVTDMIAYGTSINNIRVTNSFQRFLERAQHGLRYRHQMKSHLGVSVDYPDIDIPQYIGGFNGEINSVRNENMAASEYANLGDFNGSLFANISSKHPISVQVPEHGYILGIMTIVPVPIYPQSVTNKALIKRSPFEYPLQEFMRTGNEPVFYKELMPLQTGADQSVDDVAGYRRPFAEYLNNLDEAHGDFRTTLKDFACMRMFAERPELSEEFTTVHPEELNQIFISENIADKFGSNSKFLCRIDYKMSGLRQIPDDMPSLE